MAHPFVVGAKQVIADIPKMEMVGSPSKKKKVRKKSGKGKRKN